jgi:lipopolysaccharide biosynthesis protein
MRNILDHIKNRISEKFSRILPNSEAPNKDNRHEPNRHSPAPISNRDRSLSVPFEYIESARPTRYRVAAIGHIFYGELAPQFRRYLSNIPGTVDLFISTCDAQQKSSIAQAFADWPQGSVDVRVLENRGRDIAPKLLGFRDVYDRYDIVLHLHSKRSEHASILSGWREYLLKTLIGSPQIVTSIFDVFERHGNIGMVAAQHFEPVRPWVNWGQNLAHAHELGERMRIPIDPDGALDFPSGSMFWARTAALRPVLDLDLKTASFEPEEGQTDGTLAHAIERLYFCICEKAGFDWIKISKADLMTDQSAISAVKDMDSMANIVDRHIFRLIQRRSEI